jgi:transketolase C-terminal domain/subunit
VTLENHTIMGGLGEALPDSGVSAGVTQRIVPIALPDEFLLPARSARPFTTLRSVNRRRRLARIKAESRWQ